MVVVTASVFGGFPGSTWPFARLAPSVHILTQRVPNITAVSSSSVTSANMVYKGDRLIPISGNFERLRRASWMVVPSSQLL